MSDGTSPNPKDIVRIDFAAIAAEPSEDPYMVNVIVTRDNGKKHTIAVPTYAVTVVSRADDPSKDPVGTVRQDDFEGGYSLFQCFANHSNPELTGWIAVYSTEPARISTLVGSYEHDHVVGLPIIGVVPGTPADERTNKTLSNVLEELLTVYDDTPVSHRPDKDEIIKQLHKVLETFR